LEAALLFWRYFGVVLGGVELAFFIF